MGYRRNRPNWRRGGRDTFPLVMAGLVTSMVLALAVTVVWAALGGGSDPVDLAPSVAAASPAAEAPGESRSVGAPEEAISAESERAAPAAEPPAPAGSAAADERADPPPRRSVVMPVSTRPAPPRRPMAPADTTAAGHAGLAEALLAAGDTSGAVAAYSAFLVRNTDPDRERAAIARLREIGGSRR